MFRGKRLAIAAALLVIMSSSSITPAEAAGVTATQTVAASFYNCTKSSSWTTNPASWKLKYPYAVNKKYYLFAITALGPFDLVLSPSSKYAVVAPSTQLGQKLWKKMGCPSGYKTKVWYAYVDSLFNGGGATD